MNFIRNCLHKCKSGFKASQHRHIRQFELWYHPTVVSSSTGDLIFDYRSISSRHILSTIQTQQFSIGNELRHFHVLDTVKYKNSDADISESRHEHAGHPTWQEEGTTSEVASAKQNDLELNQGTTAEQYIPVNALYIARSLDLKGLLGGPLRNFRSHFVRNNVVARFPDRSDGPASRPARSPNQEGDSVAAVNERYMVAFQYGSVVFFNFELEEQEVVLDMMLPFCTDHFREVRKDDYGVVVCPSLSGWSEGGQDHVLVRQLDINNIRVISSVLGQSVALDFYAKKVDEMVNTFSDLNRGMENTGTFTMKRKKLFQLVAAANTTLADVILRLGLLERSDTAWKFAQYAKIWEYMRDDFELDERFESLDFKLNIIQHNVRFFLEILQNRKSDTLEWIIILLIAGEICVSLYEIISKAMDSSAPAISVSAEAKLPSQEEK